VLQHWGGCEGVEGAHSETDDSIEDVQLWKLAREPHQSERSARMTYGGGGGDDNRRLCLGFGLPLGNDEFLCARNWMDDRRGSS
jgi:hypothetical protein